MLKSLLGFIVLQSLFIDVSSAIQLANQGCLKNRLNNFSGLRQNVSIFPEDNRGALSIRGPQEGFADHDMQKARQNIAKLTCPGTTDGNGGAEEAILMGAEDQITTNAHSLIDEKGRPRDPLSKCFINFPGHDGPEANKKYYLALKDGLAGIKDLESRGLLRIGDRGKHNADDYAAVKLVERVPGVKAYQLGLFPYMHACEAGESTCQHLEVISAISPRTKMKIADDELILQSCELRGMGLLKHRTGSVLYSNCSAPHGSSSSIAFLKDEDGQLIRGKDGELMPIAILSQSSPDKLDGRKYDGVEVWTSSISLNGDVRAAIDGLASVNQSDQRVRQSKAIPGADQSL